MTTTITPDMLCHFSRHLKDEERSSGTWEKYLRDVRRFARWLGERPLSREHASDWKLHLLEKGYAPTTVNSMLAALNTFLAFIGKADYRTRLLRVQRRLFRDESKALSRPEYEQLLATAHACGKERLALVIETLCATGIRVSELRYITVEALRARRADISLKGKIRTILLPGKLCRKLQKYARQQKTASGVLFRTRSGRALSRKQIWVEMKALAKKAGIAPSKVFPHNLRHLFARCFYRTYHDVVKLADLLGHSSIETTRLYLLATGAEHQRQIERLRLIH